MNIGEFNSIYNDFILLTKSNPVLGGIVGLWGIGILTFVLKNIPSSIFKFIKRQFTTTLVINNQDDSYYNFLKWVSDNQMKSIIRTLHINNGQYWSGLDTAISIGFGKNMFFFDHKIFFMDRQIIDASNTVATKETITLTSIGRSHKCFVKLLDVINSTARDDTTTDILTYRDGYWRVCSQQVKRDFNTVILEADAKKMVLNHINKFMASKAWYYENGIPYRTGMLLQGPPGTGKTSMIKAICGLHNKSLYMLSLSGMDDVALNHALSIIPKNSIISIEDIDTVSYSRGSDKKVSEASKDSGDLKDLLQMTLGGLLNAIDGVASNDDRIIIATTNHPELIDPALIRPGRFDIRIDVNYLTNDSFRRFINRFYANNNLSQWNVKPKITGAMAQQAVFENMNDCQAVLNKIGSKQA